MSTSQTISCAMMVRNEAATLSRALDSVQGVVDEIVIIDTGSTDGTQEIARRYADRFKERPWPDSFATARNWTLDLASCDWVLILDADEYLSGSWLDVRSHLRDDVAALECSLCNLMDGGTLKEYARQIRILRRSPSLRYEYAVHHQITDNLARHMEATGQRVVDTSFEITHTGYDLAFTTRHTKYAQRLDLYANVLFRETNPKNRQYYTYQYGACLLQCGRDEEAVEILLRDFPLMNHLHAEHAAFLTILGMLHMIQSGNMPSQTHMQEAVHRMMAIGLSNPAIMARTGNLAMFCEMEKHGLRMMARAALLAEHRPEMIRPQSICKTIVFFLRASGLKRQARLIEKGSTLRRREVLRAIA